MCSLVRHLQVLLPMATDAEVSDEVFKRTSAEVMRDFRRMQQKREQEQTLMTRVMREKLSNKTKRVHRFARLRIRFREGLVLQGGPSVDCCAQSVCRRTLPSVPTLPPFRRACHAQY